MAVAVTYVLQAYIATSQPSTSTFAIRASGIAGNADTLFLDNLGDAQTGHALATAASSGQRYCTSSIPRTLREVDGQSSPGEDPLSPIRGVRARLGSGSGVVDASCPLTCSYAAGSCSVAALPTLCCWKRSGATITALMVQCSNAAAQNRMPPACFSAEANAAFHCNPAAQRACATWLTGGPSSRPAPPSRTAPRLQC